MASSLPEKHVPKIVAEPVRLAVQDGIDELSALGLAEAYRDVPEIALELVHDRFERVPASLSANRDFLRTEGADDQDAAPSQVPAEVEEQADGTRIRPLQVVYDKQ
jgi:hypothetical protein